MRPMQRRAPRLRFGYIGGKGYGPTHFLELAQADALALALHPRLVRLRLRLIRQDDAVVARPVVRLRASSSMLSADSPFRMKLPLRVKHAGEVSSAQRFGKNRVRRGGYIIPPRKRCTCRVVLDVHRGNKTIVLKAFCRIVTTRVHVRDAPFAHGNTACVQ